MISTLKNNITLLKIQRKSLQRSLEMMDNNWGTYTTMKPGLKWQIANS